VGRHVKDVQGRPRFVRATALVVVWVGGLGSGFFALLSVAARYTGCSSSAHGLACRPAGTALGGLLVLCGIATVTAATVLTHDRELPRVVLCGVLGMAVLGMWYLAAHALLDTA
jgi:hypothetical protein